MKKYRLNPLLEEDFQIVTEVLTDLNDISIIGLSNKDILQYNSILGKFENVLDFKNRLRENIKVEKEAREQDKRRLEIVKNIVTEIKIELPEIIIESETQNMLNQMKRDIERSGLKFEEYLQNINKKEADLKKDWQKVASDRVIAEIIIRKIGEAENLKPEEKEIEENFSVLASSVQKEKVSPEVLKNYVYDSLFKEKVFSFLENLANSK